MSQVEGKISDLLKAFVDGDKSRDIYEMKATKEQFDEFFDEYDCVVVRYPENMKISWDVSYNRKTNPERVRHVKVIDFYKNPSKKHPIDTYYEKKHGMMLTKEDKQKKAEEERQRKEDELRELMKKDGCGLISKYTKASEPVYYMFEEREYKTTPTKWKAGHRAHQMQYSPFTHNYVKKCFADEGCELLTQYKNSKQILFYKFGDSIYSTTFSDWKWYNNRHHLTGYHAMTVEEYEKLLK